MFHMQVYIKTKLRHYSILDKRTTWILERNKSFLLLSFQMQVFDLSTIWASGILKVHCQHFLWHTWLNICDFDSVCKRRFTNDSPRHSVSLSWLTGLRNQQRIAFKIDWLSLQQSCSHCMKTCHQQWTWYIPYCRPLTWPHTNCNVEHELI